MKMIKTKDVKKIEDIPYVQDLLSKHKNIDFMLEVYSMGDQTACYSNEHDLNSGLDIYQIEIISDYERDLFNEETLTDLINTPDIEYFCMHKLEPIKVSENDYDFRIVDGYHFRPLINESEKEY